MVLFVHRPYVLGIQTEFGDDPSYTEIIIAKNRSGRTGSVSLRYIGDQFRFVEREEEIPLVDSRMNRSAPDAAQVGATTETTSFSPFDQDSLTPPDDWS